MTADEVAIRQVVEQAYSSLAFEPGAEPDWRRFNQLFTPDAVLALRIFPGDATVSVLGLADYARAQMGNDLKRQGYSETPGESKIAVIGDVAVVWQPFTMNFAHTAPVFAVDVFSLARVDGAWIVIAIVSDVLDRHHGCI